MYPLIIASRTLFILPTDRLLVVCSTSRVHLVASVSPPVWDKVYFLKATVGGTETVYGVFGECIKGGACTAHHVGYDLTLNGAT